MICAINHLEIKLIIFQFTQETKCTKMLIWKVENIKYYIFFYKPQSNNS